MVLIFSYPDRSVFDFIKLLNYLLYSCQSPTKLIRHIIFFDNNNFIKNYCKLMHLFLIMHNYYQ